MSSVPGDPVWTKLDEEKTVLLTTYKRDGSGVDTPIHIAVDGETAFIRTYATAWKWKRLQRNPHVTVSLANTGRMPAFLALLAPNRSRRIGQAVRARVVVLEEMSRPEPRARWRESIHSSRASSFRGCTGPYTGPRPRT